MAYESLFSPGRIGRMETKNRTVMAPMVRNYADEQGMITPKYLASIDRVARGGVGVMILDAAFISPEGKGFVRQIGIHNDECISGLKEVAQIAHKHGTLVGCQLHHAGRQTSSQVTGMQPVSASPIADPTINEVPKELSVDEIQALVQAYAHGARRAKEAGCDFVEIHGAHGYLITQFLSPFSNRREDEYGGSDDARMRFATEVVQAVREAVGPDFPVTIRLSADEMVPAGLQPDDTIKIAQQLEQLGIDAFHISAGNNASFGRGYMIQPMAIEDGPLVHLAEKIKGSVSVPVITVGKIRSPQMADDIVRTGKADFVALARVLLADPDWPKKAEEGREKEINMCIACNQGCISRLFEQLDVWCTVNPETAREIEFAEAEPESPKNILIAGGGPAGMVAAKYAVEHGHNVVLAEREDHLGGQLISAAAAPLRPGWEELRQYLMSEMERLGVDVRLNTEATAELAEQEGADVAIVAVGASQVRPSIPGIEHENVVTAVEVLLGKAQAGHKVIVAGGGCSGAQTAEFLAVRGHDVTIVEMLGEIARDSAAGDRDLLIKRLHERGVSILTETKIMSIDKGKVVVENPDGTQELEADTVVLCLGAKSNDNISDDLRSIVSEVFVVGDASEPRKVTEALVEGARAGILQFRPVEEEVKVTG